VLSQWVPNGLVTINVNNYFRGTCVCVRVGIVAVESSSVAPGTLMGNPTCLSTLYETSSYPTAPPTEISATEPDYLCWGGLTEKV